MNQKKLSKINIGAGYQKIDGLITLDISPECNPDHVVDIERDRFPFDDNSVDEVHAYHILEHLGEGFFHCMREIYRVCVHDAKIFIAVPHPRHDTFLMDPTHRRPIMEHTLVMFSRKHNTEDIILKGKETPIGIINKVDFELIAKKYHFDSRFEGVPEEQYEHVAMTCNNFIVAMDFILRVVKDDE